MKDRPSSIAELKKRFSTQEITISSTQNSARQKELEEIAAARKLAKEQAEANEEKETIKKNDALVPTTSVSSLRDKLSNTLISLRQLNVQKSQVEEDMQVLLKSNLNVRNKAKELEKLLTQSSQKAINLIKENKVSTNARKKLNIKEVLVFEEVQERVIGRLEAKLKEDFENCETLVKANPVSKERFLELSFVYRSYQVCLAQDVLRHIARKFDENNSNDAPTNLAIQSLNYYQDFFDNLSDIEKLWGEAGKEVRKSELAGMFAYNFCNDNDLLKRMLSKAYEEACIKFNEALTNFVNSNKIMKDYVQSGNGLDAMNHPCKSKGYTRLPQANSSINFKQIIATDEVHENMLKKVEEKVEDDKIRFKI